MIELFKLAVLKVDSIDFNVDIDGKYNSRYLGKMVFDSYCGMYFPESGGCFTVVSGFTTNDGQSVNAYDLWQQIVMRQWEASQNKPEANKSEEKLSIEQLTHLKASGHSVDEIIRLKSEGVL